MGQGARTIFAQVAARAGRAARVGDGRDGRHRDRALRPADVGLALDRPDGQRHPRGLPRRSRRSCGRWRRGSRRRRGRRHRRRRRRPPARRRELTPLRCSSPALGRLGGEITGVGEARKEAEPDHPLGGSPAFFEFNCTAVELSVDEQTGDITIHRHVAVSDVGKSINRLQVQMQDEGAAIMGLGHTLMEHYMFDARGGSGTWARSTTASPRPWTCRSRCSATRSRTRTGPGPYGAKGMCEGALLPVASAVAAAVRDATGVAIRDLPLSPERVWRALQERDATLPA